MNLVDIKGAVKALPLKRSTIYSYVASRKIPHVKIGSRVFFDLDELEDWVKRHRVEPTTMHSFK